MPLDINTIVTFTIVTTVIILFLISFIVFILFLYQRRHIAYQKGIETLKSDFEKALLSTQLEIQEQTFQNISREIHDNIGLSLTLAKLNLNTINWNYFDHTKEKVHSSVNFITQAIEDLSNISKTLHTDFIKENGLLRAIELEINKIKKLDLFSINFEITGKEVYMQMQKELVIFRIMQEILNNCIKHAKATSINVLLNYHKKLVEIEISDNGKGFSTTEHSAQPGSGTGLLNIVKRASFINGTCDVKSKPGEGTTIFMQIPY
jgi:signal transduction histidine kinase